MTENFWGQIYEKLIDNIELLPLVCEDTSESDLFSFISPNPNLFRLCKPFLKGKKIKSRQNCNAKVIEFAKNNRALRKILLFTWIDKNQETLKFASLPIQANSSSIELLNSGKYGGNLKIRILSYFDPRPPAKTLYTEFLSLNKFASATSEEKAPSISPPPLPPEAFKTTENENKVFLDRIKELEENLREQVSLRKASEKETEALKKEVETLNTKLREKLATIKSTGDRYIELEKEQKNLTAQLEFSLSENNSLKNKVNEQNDSVKLTSDYKEKLGALELQISSQKKAIEIRDSKITRLELELNKEKSAQIDLDENEKLVERLKEQIKSLESVNSNDSQPVSGQIQIRVLQKDGSKPWLFTSFSGQPYFIPDKLVKAAKLSNSEFCTLSLSKANGEIQSIASIEDEKSYETGYLGFINGDNNVPVLIQGETSIPIITSLPSVLEGEIIKGTLLPSFMDRAFGIYSVEKVEIQDGSSPLPKLECRSNDIKSFFRLYKYDEQELKEILQASNIKFQENTGNFIFPKDYRLMLPGIRPELNIKKVCKQEPCQQKANQLKFLALPAKNEPCYFCKCVEAGNNQDKVDFGNKKVLILGGDRVGPQYKNYLEQFNLNVKWKSGFENLGAERSGLGNQDAILIIIKQISHTLLREIVPLANEQNIPIIFSPKRGLTGVLELLTKHLLTK